jgi:SAM-dependent methyltransferase
MSLVNKNVNLNAYSQIEQISSFDNSDSILGYRSSRLEKYQQLVDFISARSLSPVSILEVGSGSSALLYACDQRKLLAKGMGVELSESRYKFAELWKKDDGYDRIINIHSNFCDVDMGTSIWDWFIIVDNTFTYLYPESIKYPEQLLQKAFEALKEEGCLLIDFINYSKRVPNLDYRQWSSFSQKDPYSYGLYSHNIEGGINKTESIFIGRDGKESRKLEFSKVYSLEELVELVSSCGFYIEGAFASFDNKPFVPAESERLVLLARKLTG